MVVASRSASEERRTRLHGGGCLLRASRIRPSALLELVVLLLGDAPVLAPVLAVAALAAGPAVGMAIHAGGL